MTLGVVKHSESRYVYSSAIVLFRSNSHSHSRCECVSAAAAAMKLSIFIAFHLTRKFKWIRVKCYSQFSLPSN